MASESEVRGKPQWAGWVFRRCCVSPLWFRRMRGQPGTVHCNIAPAVTCEGKESRRARNLGTSSIHEQSFIHEKDILTLRFSKILEWKTYLQGCALVPHGPSMHSRCRVMTVLQSYPSTLTFAIESPYGGTAMLKLKYQL